jgi:hypothetical protein
MGQLDRVNYDGVQITRRQRQAFKHVSGITVSRYNLALHAYQGSWRPRTDYSGTSHMGAGAADLYVYGMSTMDWETLVRITRLLRREGRQAAYLRGPHTNMPWHWHVLDLNTARMDPRDGDPTPESGARWQVGQYRASGGPYNGLSTGVKDVIPYRPSPIREWEYQSPGG